MKRHSEMIILLLGLCIVFPLICVGVGGMIITDREETPTTVPSSPLATTQTQFSQPAHQPTQSATEPTTVPTEPPTQEITISVLSAEGNLVDMELEEYLLGVLTAEMPVDFELEALKAQAVAARTFTLRCVIMQAKHNGAVCLKSSCCQGYLSEENYYARGGTSEDIEKFRTAIAQTRGEVLLYQGKLIQAAYFSCSGGSTEDAADVWGGDVPYLQAVLSPGEEAASAYSKTVTFTVSTFANKLGVSLSDQPDGWFGAVTYTEGGGVATMVIGGVVYTGTKLRKLLSLNSTKFEVAANATTVTVTTYGFGHRVGMSQYGADAMAVQGSTYEQILLHYFRGTELTKWVS